MRLVVLESPYAGKTPHEIARNVRYLRACMHDCFMRGDIPFASHGLYTQPGVLRDDVPEERKLGIAGGLLWGSKAEAAVIYKDLGITSGMHYGWVRHKKEGRPVEERELGPDWEKDFPGGMTPDEIAVYLDRQEDIDEIFSHVSYVHVERLDDYQFMLAIADQMFLICLEGDRIKVLYNGDASYNWDPSEDHDDRHTEITDAEGEVHKVRPCPNPDCGRWDVEIINPDQAEQIGCTACGMMGPLAVGHLTEAVALWNNLPRQINWKVRK